MPKAKRLPSGNYRVRVYDKDTKKYKSFTAETKKEAELLAVEFINGKKPRLKSEITVGEAVKAYIESKENILSPSTIRGYMIIYNNAIAQIASAKVQTFREIDLQLWVNSNVKKYTPKSIRNQFGLVAASLKQQGADLNFSDISLPQKQPRQIIVPDEQQMAQILKIIEGTSIELPVTIAVTLGLRQSEIAALKWSDYNGKTLKIHAAKVPDKDNKYIIKNTTKSQASTREIEVGELLKQRLDRSERSSEYISAMLPSSVLREFKKICKANNLPEFTMHAQRHGNASLMLAMGIPDKYAMKRLGQSSPNMIKNVYQHLFEDTESKIADDVNDKFNSIYDTKNDTKK